MPEASFAVSNRKKELMNDHPFGTRVSAEADGRRGVAACEGACHPAGSFRLWPSLDESDGEATLPGERFLPDPVFSRANGAVLGSYAGCLADPAKACPFSFGEGLFCCQPQPDETMAHPAGKTRDRASGNLSRRPNPAETLFPI